jgi:predicted secreted protein
MSIPTAIAVYSIIWWVVLFAVLPWGVRSQRETGNVASGTDPGAPAIPHLRAKLVWTTLIAAAVFGTGYALFRFRLVTFDDLNALFRAVGV